MNASEPLQSLGGNLVRWRGRRLLYFGGCDYFRFTQSPAIRQALVTGLRRHGLNVAASRKTTGEHPVYQQLERALARFFGFPGALLLPGGYGTSTVVAQALRGQFDLALLDERAHPALQDAALQLACRVQPFAHRSTADLKRHAQRAGRNARLLVLTDGMFSHDGSVAPLREYQRVLPANAWLLVDDAHGAGVLGARGRGTPELTAARRARLIQCVTLSKAFGVYGGAVLGSRQLREKILGQSRAFIGSTPLPPPLAAAALRAVGEMRRARGRRGKLHRNAAFVRTALRAAGWRLADEPGPIIALPPLRPGHTRRLRRALLAADILPPFLRYAGSPTGYFRFVISSAHTPAELTRLVRVLAAQAPGNR